MKKNAYGMIILSNTNAEVLFQKRRKARAANGSLIPEKHYIVMAKYLGKYVTWVCYANETTGLYDPEHGHYFGTDSDAAYEDYRTRR